MLEACDLPSFNSSLVDKRKSAFVLPLFRGIWGFKEQTGRLNQMVFWRQSRRMKLDDVTQRSRMETRALEDRRRREDVTTQTWLCQCAIHFVVSYERQSPLTFNIWNTCWSLWVSDRRMVELLVHLIATRSAWRGFKDLNCGKVWLKHLSIHPSIIHS